MRPRSPGLAPRERGWQIIEAWALRCSLWLTASYVMPVRVNPRGAGRPRVVRAQVQSDGDPARQNACSRVSRAVAIRLCPGANHVNRWLVGQCGARSAYAVKAMRAERSTRCKIDI